MKLDTLKYFVKNGVYKLNNSTEEFIFVCLPCSNCKLGKLSQYKKVEEIYERTGINYFLNYYIEGDIKSLFLNRQNYEMLGMIGQNFVMSPDEQKILKG